MKNNIRHFRIAVGMTQAQLAAATGVGVPQVSKWEGGKVDIPLSRLHQLAEVLATTVDDLVSEEMGEIIQRLVDEGRRQSSTEIAANAVVVPMEGASMERMQPNLPIYGTALGAPREIDGEAIEQVTLNRGEVLEYVKRPVLLNGNTLAYGLRVEGYSMEPRHRDGEMLIVDPSARVRIGDDVVVYLRPPTPEEDDGETARAVLVKRMVRRSSGYYELEQYQPAKTFRINSSDVLRVDRVVPWQELLG